MYLEESSLVRRTTSDLITFLISSIFSSFSSLYSDCEIIDVVEQAKDEKLADKLYTETLRVLKLKAI
jgi:hypothetical protein